MRPGLARNVPIKRPCRALDLDRKDQLAFRERNQPSVSSALRYVGMVFGCSFDHELVDRATRRKHGPGNFTV